MYDSKYIYVLYVCLRAFVYRAARRMHAAAASDLVMEHPTRSSRPPAVHTCVTIFYSVYVCMNWYRYEGTQERHGHVHAERQQVVAVFHQQAGPV